MAVVGRLVDHEFRLLDEIDERTPPVTRGLVAHYPFDETTNAAVGSNPTTSTRLGFVPHGRGVMVDKNSTNNWAPTTGQMGWQTNYGATVTRIDNTPFPNGFRIVKPAYESGHSTKGHWAGTFGTTLTALDTSKIYCISFWARKRSAKARVLSCNAVMSTWGGLPKTTIASHFPMPTYEWQRYYIVFQPTDVTPARPYIETNYGNDEIYEVCGMQFEELNYPSAPLLPGQSRGGTSSMTIPHTGTPNETIFITVYSDYPWSQITSQSNSPMLLQFGGYCTNPSLSLWNYNKRITTYIKGNTGSGWQFSNAHKSTDSSFWDKKEHVYALRFTGTTGWETYEVFIDGEKCGPSHTLSPAVVNMGDIIFHTVYDFGTIRRNLTIHNVALTDEEILKQSKYMLSMTADGDARVNEVEETPLIPSGVRYAHFHLGGPEDSGNGIAVSGSNVRYFDGASFIGRGTKNEITAISLTWGPWSGKTGYSDRFKDISSYNTTGIYANSTNALGGADFYRSNYINLPSDGASFTLSAVVKWTNSLHANTFYVREYNNVNGGTQLRERGWMTDATKIPLGDGWYWCTVNVTPLATTKSVLLQGYVYATTEVWVQCIQAEFKDYASPFAGYGATVPDCAMAIPSAVIPDYTGDWTVFGWYKLYEGDPNYDPIFAISDSSTDRILVMHNYGGALTCWYGNDSSGWSFGVGSRVRKLNKWLFFALRHTKADNQMKLYGFDGETFDSGYRIGAASDLNPTFTNNINIGYWSGHRATGQFRDYGFVLKALTDAEIERLAKGMMSQTKEKVYISNMIREKVL